MTKPSSQTAVSLGILSAYALPGLGLALLTLPFPALITTFYAKHTEATTAGIALVMLVCRIFNGAVDPFIGYASDATNSRFGPRKPWLSAGALLAIPAFLMAYAPPIWAGDGYFFMAMVAFYLALSILEIPLRSWSAEISSDYAQRSRLSASLTLALLLGGVGFMALPELLYALGLVESTRLDRHMMALFGGIGAMLLPLGVAVAVWVVPIGVPSPPTRGSIRVLLSELILNRPFQLFLIADWLIGVAWGVTYALLFIALDNYLGMGAQVGMLLLVATAAQIAALGPCVALAHRVGKHRAWAIATLLTAVASPLILLFPPAGKVDAVFVYALMAWVSVLSTPQMFVPASMIGDIADYGLMKSGHSRVGNYFAIRSLLFPASGAFGTAVAFFALTLVGYEPSSSVNSDSATRGMLLTLALVPTVLSLISGFLLLRFPITQLRHRAIRRAIDRRLKRLENGSELP